MIRTSLTALICAALLISACSDSEDPKPPPLGPGDTNFANLTKKEHVLKNLVASYLQRDINEYKRIIDVDYYQFFFADGDVADGLPAMGWDKTQDELATTNLLNRSSSEPSRIISIALDIEWSDLIWTEIAADRPLQETWYRVVTTYRFTFTTANDITYATHGDPLAEFTVRNIGTMETPQYRLVRWKDIGHPTIVQIRHPSTIQRLP